MTRRSPWDRPRIEPLRPLTGAEQPPKLEQAHLIGAYALTEALKSGIEVEESGSMVLHAQERTRVVQFKVGPRIGCQFHVQVAPNSYSSVTNEISLTLTMEDGTKLLGANLHSFMLWLNPDWTLALLVYLRTLIKYPLKMHIHDAMQTLPRGVVVIEGGSDSQLSVPGDF